MVQVDVFWSYGIGASFALAAFRQLRKLQAESGSTETDFDWKDMRRLIREIESGGTAFHNQYFLKTLLFLSLLFVPSGAVLLWSNPSWETMQAGEYETIPAWLVGGFTITNVTQGILGYWVTYNHLMRGKYFRAALQTVMAYVGFFFILVNGWDKTGYRRFFSASRKDFEDWSWRNVFGWMKSDVVRILLTFGAVFIPLMLYWLSKWFVEGYRMEEGKAGEIDVGEERQEMLTLCGDLMLVVFGITLGSAIVATLLIRWFGWVKGLALFAAVFGAVQLSSKGPGRALARKIMRVDSLEAPPVSGPVVQEIPEEEQVAAAV